MQQRALIVWVVCLGGIIGGFLCGRADAQVASVTFIQGTVEHLPTGQTQYAASRVGQALQEGFRVRTGKRSRAEIRFANRNVVTLSQLSECTIHNARDTDLAKGSMRGEYSSAARVRSGSTVANIAGTKIIIQRFENPDGTVTTRLFYVEGDPNKTEAQQIITLFTPEGTLQLRPGQTLSFTAPPPPPGSSIDDTVAAAPNFPIPEARIRLGSGEHPAPGEARIDVAPPDRFAGEFIDFALSPGNTIPGTQISNMTGTNVQVDFRSDPIQRQQDTAIGQAIQPDAGIIAQEPTVRGPIQIQPPPPPPPGGGGDTGGIGVIVTSPVGPGRRPPTAIKRYAAPGGLPSGVTTYFAPRADYSLFLFKGEGSSRAVTAFMRQRGVLGGVYWEVAFAPTNFYNTSSGSTQSDLDLTDAFVTFRSAKRGELTIGRQRFLKGPVQNTIIGTLMRQGGRDIQDAITYSPKFSNKRIQLDLSYVIDAFPGGLPTAVEGTQPGAYGRLQYQTNFGTLGLNVAGNSLGPKTGVTADFAIPVVKNRVEFYGEIGRDTFDRRIRTLGLYFPDVYQKYSVDVFFEYTRLTDFGLPSEWLLRIYPRFGERYTGFIAIDKRSGGDTRIGVGVAIDLGRRRK